MLILTPYVEYVEIDGRIDAAGATGANGANRETGANVGE